MSQYIFMRMKQSRKGQNIAALAVSLLICALLSGCTHLRVSNVARQPPGTPIKASDVQFVSSFKDIKGPWRLEGTISGYMAPLFKNNAENRESYLREMAADMGINTVVGFLPNVGEGVGGVSHVHVIMANSGSSQEQNSDPMPKFIICLPPANFKIEKTPPLSKLDEYLREYLQYVLGYGKGYYAYYCNTPGVDNSSILQGNASLDGLSEPIGIQPDFALLSDVDGYDVEGNIVIRRSNTLKLTMTLYDIKEKKSVWSCSTEGICSSSLLGAFFIGLVAGPVGGIVNATVEGVADSKDVLRSVSNAVNNAMKDFPEVKGFKKGGGGFPI